MVKCWIEDITRMRYKLYGQLLWYNPNPKYDKYRDSDHSDEHSETNFDWMDADIWDTNYCNVLYGEDLTGFTKCMLEK